MSLFLQTAGQSPSNGAQNPAAVANVNFANGQQALGNVGGAAANFSQQQQQQYQQYYANATQNNFGTPQGYGGYSYPGSQNQIQQGNDKN